MAVENLAIRKIFVRRVERLRNPGVNVRAGSGFNGSIVGQTWGVLVSRLDYKAGWYGGEVVRVDPRIRLSHVRVVEW